MTSVFEEYAISHGMYRRVVSLAANSVLLGSQLVIDDWFHFYLDVWSAVTFFFSPAHMSANHLKPAIDRFFADAAPSAYMKKTLAFKTPALARQHECTTMSENAKLHVQQFVSRLQNMVRSSIVAVQKRHYATVTADAPIATAVVDCILAVPDKYDELRLKLRTRCEEVDAALFGCLAYLLEERARLGELVSTVVTYKVKQATRTGTLLTRILDGNKGDALLYRLLPHLERYSIANQQLLEAEGLVQSPLSTHSARALDVQADSASDEVTGGVADGESESDDEPENACRCWTRTRRPKPFRMLPLCKMQRSMVYYGWTELKAMFSDLVQREQRERRALVAQEMQARPKRKRGEQLPEKPQIQYVDPFFTEEPDQLEVFKHLFDLRKIKGVNQLAHVWRLCCFRTNGIKCVLTFVSGDPGSVPYHGATGLTRPGYRYISVPEEKIDIRTERRGLYRINQYRNDMLPLPDDPLAKINFGLDDPGFNRIIQHGTIEASCVATPDAVAAALCKDDALWHLTQAELMAQSGRETSRQREKTRRRVNVAYATAIESFSATRGRSADRTTLNAYAHVAFDTFEVMATELTHTGRAIARWQASRSLQRFLATVTNRIFQNASTRMYRQPVVVHTKAERTVLRQKLRVARQRKREEKTVAFFGDGTFDSRISSRARFVKREKKCCST